MAEVIILGSSSGMPSPARACASIAVKHGGKIYQFDAGEGASSSILRNKIDHSRICAIFISHGHIDHLAGLFLEIQMMHLAKRREPLAAYLPEETMLAVEEFMRATYLFKERLGFDIAINAVKPDPVFRDDNIAVYARANSHLAPYKDFIESEEYSNKMQSYTYVIRTKNRKIIYSGDVGSLDDYSDLLPGCDLLITEGLHLDLDALFEQAGANNVNHVVLSHLSDQMYSRPKSIENLAAKYGIGDLRIAEDGMRLSL